MKAFIKIVILVFSLMISVNYSYASTITSQFGDVDGFNGLLENDNTFIWLDSVHNDVPIADDVHFSGNKSWTHNYILPNNFSINSVSFEIFHGGDGSLYPASLFINSYFVGPLTQVDSPLKACLDTFNIPSNLISIFMDGSATITVSPYNGINDEWIFDYSKLTITGSQVPIPSSLLLLGSGFLGLAGWRMFRKG